MTAGELHKESKDLTNDEMELLKATFKAETNGRILALVQYMTKRSNMESYQA